jgi:GxxExxY protein
MALARDSRRARRLPCVTAMLIDAAFNPTTERIIGAALEVHRHIGPGLLESTYLECLEAEFADRGIRFERERVVPIVYKQKRLKKTYKLDLVIENLVVVEVKSVAAILGVHEAQVITYLKLTGHPVGLLINFNVAKLTAGGVKRLVHPDVLRKQRAREND